MRSLWTLNTMRSLERGQALTLKWHMKCLCICVMHMCFDRLWSVLLDQRWRIHIQIALSRLFSPQVIFGSCKGFCTHCDSITVCLICWLLGENVNHINLIQNHTLLLSVEWETILLNCFSNSDLHLHINAILW